MSYDKAFQKAEERKMIAGPYLELSLQNTKSRGNRFAHFFDQRKWPEIGWDEQTIEILLNELSSMDSNNYSHKASVGEREGRIFCPIVARRHFRMSHGIGRSGDLGEAQPKAAGSSLLSCLANSLVKDLIKCFVSRNIVDAFILPMATGMSLALVMLTMKKSKPEAKFVIWSRIDQKSCFKSILTAGLTPIIVHPLLKGDELVTDIESINERIEHYGRENILCIMTTTSCFAPRACDNVVSVGEICKKNDLYHLVNNAYGVQSTKCAYAINETHRSGRLDVFVQSTDKNIMVPVGGTIISGFCQDLLKSIKENYPGRASCSQTLDVFITMLSMGRSGYERLLESRKLNYDYLLTSLTSLASEYHERILINPGNNISIGMTLSSVNYFQPKAPEKIDQLTEVGSMLFRRNVNGARVVIPSVTKVTDSYVFTGWGSHSNCYPTSYITCAATIGMESKDVDIFIHKLGTCLSKINNKGKKPQPNKSDIADPSSLK